MWMLKGTFYGVVAFVVFGLFFFFRKFPIRANSAIGLSMLRALTCGNPWFWATFVFVVCTGCVYARWLEEFPNR
jgi:hypothetical protein